MTGRFDQAIADCGRALELAPGYARAYANRAEAYRQKGDLERALTDGNEAVRLEGGYAWAYFVRAAVHYDRGDYGEAAADYTRAMKLAPGYWRTYWALAWLRATCPNNRYRDGRQAVSLARQGCELTGWQETELLLALAAAHAECGQFDEAERWQTRALERMEPGHRPPYAALLEDYRSRRPHREPPPAGTAMGRSRERVREGNAHLQKGEIDRAIEAFNEAVRLDPDNAYAYANRGIAYLDEDEPLAAVRDLTRALQLEPAIAASVRVQRGSGYLAQGSYREAVADFSEAIRLNPKDADAYQGRAEAFRKLGERARAAEDARRARELRR